MTVIENYSPKVQYTGPVAIDDLLPISFPYNDTEDVKCLLNQTELVFNEDYTVTGQGLIFKITATEEDTITIYRDTPLDQQAEFPQNNRFNSAKLNASLDKICMQQQEQNEKITRSVKVPIDTNVSFEGSLPTPLPNRILRINEEASGFEFVPYDLDERLDDFEDRVIDNLADVQDDLDAEVTAITNKVNTVVATSEDAKTTADNALTIVNSADAKSDNAVSVANEASQAASSAVDTANSANEYSIEARNLAAEARDISITASETAIAASTKVDTFEEDIETVIEAAEQIAQLEEAVDTAVQASENATQAAEDATQAAADAVAALDSKLDVDGTAVKAIADADGNIITETYRTIVDSYDKDEIDNALSKISSMPIGTIYQAIRTDIPEGSLRLDGTEFTTGFEGFVTNYLATGKIISKSLAEWQTEYTMTNGNVGFFGYDEATGKFKTPCIQAGTFLAQAITSGDFGSFLNSELKSHTHTQNAHNHSFSGTAASAGAHTHTRGTMNITGTLKQVVLNAASASGAFSSTTKVSEEGEVSGNDHALYNVNFNASNNWTGSTSSNGAHTHTVSGTTGSTTATNQATGGNDTYPKHIRYPFFVVVSNVAGEEPSQVDWDNFVGNLDSRANLSLDNLDENGQAKLDAKANTSLNNLNSSGQTKFDAKVNKAGDVVTGTLRFNVNKQYSDPICIICPEMDWTTAPTRNTNAGIHFYDKNGKVGPYFLVVQNAGSAQNYIGIGYNSTNDPNFVGFNLPKATSKATTTSTASAYKPAVVIQNYVNGNSWYRVWSDGWIEQGGVATLISTEIRKVTLLKSFSNTNYGVWFGDMSASAGGINYAGIINKSKGSFTAAHSSTGAGSHFWRACGY